MSKFGPGTLIEISRSGGLGYTLVAHLHPSYPEILHVYRGLRPSTPEDLATFAERSPWRRRCFRSPPLFAQAASRDGPSPFYLRLQDFQSSRYR